ncbi:MAG TPA: toll/interleukin-1 receptor domain-containing protein, partial [Longimicrobiaceae bacterium]
MTHPVFISYARDASREHAVALHEALGEEIAFLDTEDIATGDHFPERLVDSLFDAKVVVIFAEPVYFTRWYCLLEFRIARTPFLRMVEHAGSTPAEQEDALHSIVIAYPPRGVSPEMERFPSLVGATNWPSVQEPEKIAEMVLARLAANPPTLRERYAALGDADSARRTLLEATKLPPPMRIGSIPFVPQVGLPTTIGDAFVGRADDLWRIHDVLTTERGSLATAAGLTGSIEAGGGFGKTRLALEYLYRFGPRHYKGGLFWIDAEGDPELQLYDVLRSLNPSAPDITAVRAVPGGVPGAVARAIRARPEKDPSALFILDNIPEPPSGEPPRPLETWCPVLGEVPVLATSRTRVALGSVGNVVALPLETLEPDAAVALLTTGISRVGLEPDEWYAIAEWVGYLPLALELLNRLVRSGGMTSADLLEASRQERLSITLDKAMDALRGIVQPGALRGVTEALAASYERLTQAEQYAARLLAWLAPDPIPEIVVAAFGPEVFPTEV